MAKSRSRVRERRVARTLRRWRKSRDLTLEQVSSQLGWSAPKLSRFERAEYGVGPAEIIALATILGVDEESRDRAVRLAISAAQREDIWGSYGPEALRGSFKDFVDDESDAVEVRNAEVVLISGLLQTADYAEALVRVWEPDADDEVITARTKLRQQRQARLDDSDNPLRLHAILYEPALRLPIGGPKVMREQLDYLLVRAELPNVTLQVLPASLGAFPGLGVAYHLVVFDSGEDGAEAVYLEQLKDGTYVEETDEVDEYILNFRSLAGLALSPQQSAERIAEIRNTWQ